MADSETTQAIAEGQAQQKPFQLAARIVKRQALLENDTERTEWIERCKDVIRLVRPDLVAWLWNNLNRGEKAGQYMHTSKPFTDAQKSADGFVGNAFGEDNWVVPTMPELMDLADPREKNILQKWFQQCSKWLTDEYRFGTFMMIQPAQALDSLTIGDSLTYTGQKKRVVYHKHCNILDAYLKRGHDLQLRMTHYLEHYMAAEAYEEWGEKLSPDTCRAVYVEPTRRVTVIRCVYEADDPIFQGLEKYLDRAADYTHYEFLIEKDSRKNTTAYDSDDPLCGILEQHGYIENPFSDWPYWLNNQESYGWSPYAAALISIKRLHLQYKTMANAAQQATDPAMKTTVKNKNRIDLRPGKMSYLDNPNEMLEEAYRRPVQYPFSIDFLERTENELEEVLHLSLYQAMMLRTKEMTVPEVLEVIGEKARLLSPRIGMYQYLYANPIHQRRWALAKTMKEGPIYREPENLSKVIRKLGLSEKPRMLYRGPLAQASEMVFVQRRVQSNVALLQAVASLGEQATLDVQDSVKAGKLSEHIMDSLDMFQDVIASEEEIKQQRQRRQVIAMAQTAAAVGKDAARADLDVAKAQERMQKGAL